MFAARASPDDLERLSRLVGDDLERFLESKVVAVAVPETILDRPATVRSIVQTFGKIRGASSGCRREGQNFGSSSISHAEKPMIGSTLSVTNVHLN